MCFQAFSGAQPTSTLVEDSYTEAQSHMSSTIQTEALNEATGPSQSEDCLFLKWALYVLRHTQEAYISII